MQTSLGCIYSDSYLLGVNFLKEAVGGEGGGEEGGVGLRKDEQKNRDKLSRIIKQSKSQHIVAIIGAHLLKYSKAMNEECSLNIIIQGSSIIWDEG